MKIQTTYNNTFKGYDARALRGFLVNSNCEGIADKMLKIGQKEGFNIFCPHTNNANITYSGVAFPKTNETFRLWAQDYWTIAKNKLFSYDVNLSACAIKNFFGLKDDFTEKVARETPNYKKLNQDIWKLFENISDIKPDDFEETFLAKEHELDENLYQAHIQGGNLFIVKDGSSDSVIVGEKELEKYDEDEIAGMYGVEDVIVLPQMDYHLDLFIRPLDKKRILLADDNMSWKALYEGLSKLKKYIDTLPSDSASIYNPIYDKMLDFVRDFTKQILYNDLPKADEIEEILEDNGYEVIRVPGRVYDIDENNEATLSLQHFCNFINANALINKDGELVYITNKSDIDERCGLTPELCKKIGFSFEESFYDSISQYVKPEHFYLVDGEHNFISKKMVTELRGGIHCFCSEVPEE